ncbi:hypothetical protein D3C81_1328820 [compost metagenome]
MTGLIYPLCGIASRNLDNPQLLATQPLHGSKPVLHRRRLTTAGHDQDLVWGIGRIFEYRLDTMAQQLQVLASINNDRHPWPLIMLIANARKHGALRRSELERHTQSLQMRPEYLRRLKHTVRFNQPIRVTGLALHEQLSDMPDDLQAIRFDHPPEQVMGRQRAELRSKTT